MVDVLSPKNGKLGDFVSSSYLYSYLTSSLRCRDEVDETLLSTSRYITAIFPRPFSSPSHLHLTPAVFTRPIYPLPTANMPYVRQHITNLTSHFNPRTNPLPLNPHPRPRLRLSTMLPSPSSPPPSTINRPTNPNQTAFLLPTPAAQHLALTAFTPALHHHGSQTHHREQTHAHLPADSHQAVSADAAAARETALRSQLSAVLRACHSPAGRSSQNRDGKRRGSAAELELGLGRKRKRRLFREACLAARCMQEWRAGKRGVCEWWVRRREGRGGGRC